MEERFKAVLHLREGDLYAYIPEDCKTLYVEGNDFEDCVGMNVVEARALRDYLDKVLP